jgi:anti-anti-sigma regulatory factor
MSTTEASHSGMNSQAAEQQAWIDRSLSTPASSAIRVENLSIAHVRDLHAAVCSRADAGGTLVLDLAAVDTIDTAGIQLLIAIHQDASRRGQAVELSGMPDAASSAIRLLGMANELGLAGPAQ